MAYTIKDNWIYRDEERVAAFTPDGTLTMVEGCEDYRLPANKALREFLDGKSGAVTVSRTPQTIRELVAAMQQFISEPCPAFSRFYGDKTPEVIEWIKAHEDIRKNILRKGENNG